MQGAGGGGGVGGSQVVGSRDRCRGSVYSMWSLIAVPSLTVRIVPGRLSNSGAAATSSRPFVELLTGLLAPFGLDFLLGLDALFVLSF